MSSRSTSGEHHRGRQCGWTFSSGLVLRRSSATEEARRLINSAYRLENDPVRSASYHEGISFSSPHIQRAIPRIAQSPRAARIQVVSARGEVFFVDVSFGKRSRLHPVDPYRNWDIDSQNRRMLHHEASPIGKAVCKDRIAGT